MALIDCGEHEDELGASDDRAGGADRDGGVDGEERCETLNPGWFPAHFQGTWRVSGSASIFPKSLAL